MMCCGIDIGTENMALSFIYPDGEVVSYKGKVLEGNCYLNRYVRDQEPTELRLVNKMNYFHGICALLAIVPEMKNTVRTFIELQVGQHSTKILKIEGAIIGFLLGRYIRMEVVSCSSQKRTKFADAIVASRGLAPIKLYNSPKATKKNTMHAVGHLYPAFYEYVTQFCTQGCSWYIDKMDDICDTIAYAHMAVMG